MEIKGQLMEPTLTDFVGDANFLEMPQKLATMSKQSTDFRGRYYDISAIPVRGELIRNAESSSLGVGNTVYSVGPSTGRSKRKRVISTVQRQAANIRERKRMFGLNEAFDDLRKKVPTFAYEKRLSRIETLRLAIVYISFMTDLLNMDDGDDSC